MQNWRSKSSWHTPYKAEQLSWVTLLLNMVSKLNLLAMFNNGREASSALSTTENYKILLFKINKLWKWHNVYFWWAIQIKVKIKQELFDNVKLSDFFFIYIQYGYFRRKNNFVNTFEKVVLTNVIDVPLWHGSSVELAILHRVVHVVFV